MPPNFDPHDASYHQTFARRAARGVEVALGDVLARHLRDAGPLGPAVTVALGRAADLCLRGGGRLRAVLVAAGYHAAGGAGGPDAVVGAGVAFELLQTFALIHDDWMDGDARRRGGPALHVDLRPAFRDAAAGASVVVGDYFAAMATESLAGVSGPPGLVLAAVRAFARMQFDLGRGQLLDLAAGRAAPGAAERTHALKTGSYTFEGPLAVGALLAGAPGELLDGLCSFARPLGVAYQLRDDAVDEAPRGSEGAGAGAARPARATARARRRIAALVADARLALGGIPLAKDARATLAGVVDDFERQTDAAFANSPGRARPLRPGKPRGDAASAGPAPAPGSRGNIGTPRRLPMNEP